MNKHTERVNTNDFKIVNNINTTLMTELLKDKIFELRGLGYDQNQVLEYISNEDYVSSLKIQCQFEVI